ncbi:MAG: hypothetical protein HOI50_00155, partial [Verrucomicrobia bacterium]|nr:hypothetical protein [Verrucomicrobiota bacterium]
MRDNEALDRRQKIERFVRDRDVPLTRLLLYTRWFKWGLLLMLLMILSLPISLIKYHRVTPDGFKPAV